MRWLGVIDYMMAEDWSEKLPMVKDTCEYWTRIGERILEKPFPN